MKKTKEKILFFVSEDWYFLSHRLGLAKDALSLGYDVVLITNVTDKLEEITAAGIKVLPLKINRAGINIFNEVVTLKNIFNYIFQEKPNYIHNISLKPILYGSFAGFFLNTKIINTFAGLGILCEDNSNAKPLFRSLITFIIKILMKQKKASIIVQNNRDFNFFTKKRIASNKQVNLILGSGINLSEYNCLKESNGEINIILASRMLWSKGIKEFVDASLIINKKFPNAKFKLIGRIDEKNSDGVDISYLQNLSQYKHIKWYGHTDNMLKVFSESNIVCLPTFYGEGIPKVLIEASACQRAVICSNIPGCTEIIQDGINGLIIEPKNSLLLAEAIEKLISSPSLRNKMGKSGREIVARKFTMPIINKQTLGLYK